MCKSIPIPIRVVIGDQKSESGFESESESTNFLLNPNPDSAFQGLNPNPDSNPAKNGLNPDSDSHITVEGKVKTPGSITSRKPCWPEVLELWSVRALKKQKNKRLQTGFKGHALHWSNSNMVLWEMKDISSKISSKPRLLMTYTHFWLIIHVSI